MIRAAAERAHIAPAEAQRMIDEIQANAEPAPPREPAPPPGASESP